MKVFLSYSRRDEAVAHLLSYILHKRGVRCLIDRQLRAGTSFDEKLCGMLEEADLVLVLLTSASAASAWVNQEIGYALAHKKEVWPLAMEAGLTPVGMLAGLETLSFSDWSRPLEAIDSLIEALASSDAVLPSFSGVDVDRIIAGRIERTKFAARLFERLLKEKPTGLKILVQAAFSVFAVSTDPLYRVGEFHSDEYIALLLEERRLLSKLADLQGSQMRLLLWPVRAYESRHLAARYKALAEWMRSQRMREDVGFLIGRYIGPNRYLIPHRITIEGYKLHHTPGYEMTIVRQSSDKLDEASRDFSLMYRKAKEAGETKERAIAEIERLYLENATAGERS